MDIAPQEYNSRRAQVEALKAKLTEPTVIKLDREALKVGLTVVRQIDDPSNDHIVIESDPTIRTAGER